MSVHREGAIPACIAVGIPACLAAGLQGGVSRPTPKGEVEGDLVQAHSQVGSWRGGSGPGPQPRGELRGIWSRPTSKGEVEGDLPGGWGVPGLGELPDPGGGGCLLWGCLVETPPDGYSCRWYASYWNAFLFP